MEGDSILILDKFLPINFYPRPHMEGDPKQY